MADITINDLAGNCLGRYDSNHKTTVGELKGELGAGVLKKEDGVNWTKTSLVLTPGTYTLGPAIEPQEQLKSRLHELQKENELLSYKYQISQILNARVKSTTERLLTCADDELSLAFDNANVIDFWLRPVHNSNTNAWAGNWEQYATTTPSRKEKSVIQPAINKEFEPNFPDTSCFVMVNTSNGWQKMTQDATLFLKNHSHVELTAAAIFEWVGQDENSFPSKRHKAKFVRDCMRLYSRCGHRREVHGIISDLSRVVAVRLVSVNESMVPQLEKTAVLYGRSVQTVLSQFAFASPEELSVAATEWIFGTTRVEAKSSIGSGFHGRVFSVVGFDDKFVKTFDSVEGCNMEKGILDFLGDRSVPGVPKVESASTDGKAFLATPVCRPLRQLQGQTVAWQLGAKFVVCLERAHGAGICHRDVRPCNSGFLSLTELIDDSAKILLFDWASAQKMGSPGKFVGTVHYAAREVLECLGRNEHPVPQPCHDLESLVYTFWAVTRQVGAPPRAVCIDGSLNSEDSEQFVSQVQAAWQTDAEQHPGLAELLSDARQCNYAGLANRMKLKA